MATQLHGYAATWLWVCVTRRFHDLKNKVYHIPGKYVVISARGLKNGGYYLGSTLGSAQCVKNEINYMNLFFSLSVVVGLKNLERDTLRINLFRISNPNPNRRRPGSRVAL